MLKSGRIFWLCLCCACSALKARPLPDTSFLPYKSASIKSEANSPFQLLYYPDRLKLALLQSNYQRIFIRPVNTSFLIEKIDKAYQTPKLKQARMEEALEVARYLEQRFKVTLNDAAPMKLKIVENPSGDTLVLELNLVELMPTNPGVNTIGTAAGLLVPGGGLLKFAGTGSIALEGVLRDGVTNDVVAVFKDREQDKGGPFSVKDFEEYGHVRSIIDEWAMQYALLATKPLGTEVADSLPIALLPY